MNMTVIVIALLAALALLYTVAVILVTIAPQAEAGCERGPAVNRSLERSNGRCFDRGTF